MCVCMCSKANAKRWEEECLLLRKGHTPKAAAEEEELQQLREENGSMKKEVSPRDTVAVILTVQAVLVLSCHCHRLSPLPCS